MSSKLCVVEIKGGFGNQLFQYNFANFLKIKGFNVKIDNYFYKTLKKQKGITLRSEVFDPSLFNFKNISLFERQLFKLLKKLNDSKKIKKYLPFFEDKYYRYYKDTNFNDKNIIEPYSHFDGYWQDIHYLKLEPNFVNESLMKLDVINKAKNTIPQENSFMLIVRRGDYVDMDQDLGLDFYEECFEKISRISENPIINIFTDDIKWVEENDIFKNVSKIYGPKNEPQEVIELFSEMLKNNHFFVCNSTFSFFAALIGKKITSKIFVADPWFRNRNSKNLLFEDWIKIRNR
tara:strand:- start:27688 stop:28557 length:870 start_codon:yes stop_codon:yes gene_type:complete